MALSFMYLFVFVTNNINLSTSKIHDNGSLPFLIVKAIASFML